MAVFAVTYDVNTPNTFLRGLLLAAIKDMGGVQLSESTYAVHFSGTAKELYQKLAVHTDANDTLIAMQINRNCYGETSDEAKEWFLGAEEAGWFS